MDAVETQVIGFGASALGIVLASDRLGFVDKIARDLVFIEKKTKQQVEDDPCLNYRITSNSPGAEFVESVYHKGIFREVVATDEFQGLLGNTHSAIQLHSYACVARKLVNHFELFAKHIGHNTPIKYGVDIARIVKTFKGYYISYDRAGEPVAKSRNIILASGGAQDRDISEVLSREVRASTRIFKSEQFLRMGFCREASAFENVNICVIGGSHSGFSCITKLLRESSRCRITLIYKGKILTYQKIKNENIKDIEDSDFDLDEEFVHINRFSGLRYESLDVYKKILNKTLDIQLLDIKNLTEEFLQEQDVLIDATGYRQNFPEIVNANGESILKKGMELLVDHNCKIKIGNDYARENIYGIGLVSPKRTRKKIPRVGVNIFHGEDAYCLMKALYLEEYECNGITNTIIPLGGFNG